MHRAAVQEEKHKVLDAADAALRAARQLVATLFGIAPSEHQDVGAELAEMQRRVESLRGLVRACPCHASSSRAAAGAHAWESMRPGLHEHKHAVAAVLAGCRESSLMQRSMR